MANVRHPPYPAAPLVTVFMILVVAWFALLATFYNHPTIDIDISSAFFSGPVCAKALGTGLADIFRFVACRFLKRSAGCSTSCPTSPPH